jgi:molybdopterin-guanine dinucleotide biosynthesis protein A
MFDAIILAGGQGTRLGGRDKAELDVGGRRLLDIALDATAGAGRVIVVGPRRPAPPEVLWRREDPPGGGPVAALAAGAPEVVANRVVVLGVDYPFADPPSVARLLASQGDAQGALALDAEDEPQPLFAVYETEALRAALARHPSPDGAAVRDLVQNLELNRVEIGPRAMDCDTWRDLAAARRAADGER